MRDGTYSVGTEGYHFEYDGCVAKKAVVFRVLFYKKLFYQCIYTGPGDELLTRFEHEPEQPYCDGHPLRVIGPLIGV